jgi:DNA-binding NtrC family response regulator
MPELVDAFLRRYNASAARPVTGVSPRVMDVLFDHDWPGNVRELENVVTRALVLAEGGELTADHIDLEPSRSETGGPSGSIALTAARSSFSSGSLPAIGSRPASTPSAPRSPAAPRCATCST